MKILLISGHGAGDAGACGNGCREADLTREVVNMLKNKLSNYAQVDVYNQDRNAYCDVNKGSVTVDFANYNYVFEVHFNAGGGEGTEIFVTREEAGTAVEEKIMQKLSKHFKVRGVKRKNFNVIANARKKGVSSALLEVCFIDNAKDVNTYKSNKEDICNLVAEGIAEGFNLSKAEETPNLRYRTHVEELGWTDWKDSGTTAGTENESKRIEAVIFESTGGLEISYRAHVEDLGWTDWKNSGEIAGTTGESKRLEAIEIRCNRMLEVQEHVENDGWTSIYKAKNFILGTVGKSLRLEAFRINIV